ncbi:MAG TPA: enoyl-CoA hydratase-related protein [Solirubrobacteraceae bacterium]|nr:enoyl-CoA hydratase-related protein [Solirubrobacteraceae bacterium]
MSSSSPSPSDGRLLVDEPAPHVARLTISNPEKRGALDHAILDSFAETLPRLTARCVIITGQGRTFSAGYDIGDLRGGGGGRFADEAERLVAHPFTAAIDAVEAYPYPTIAALNGHAIGGGLELALSCDLRLAAHPIKMGMPPAKLGLVYSHTGIRKFIDVIGAARTRELFLVGGRINASKAHLWGLVNDVLGVDELAAEAVALAREIAANAPLAQQGNKRVIRAVLDGEATLAPEVERELLALRHACFSSEDFREGVRAFAEKRPPQWKGR